MTGAPCSSLAIKSEICLIDAANSSGCSFVKLSIFLIKPNFDASAIATLIVLASTSKGIIKFSFKNLISVNFFKLLSTFTSSSFTKGIEKLSDKSSATFVSFVIFNSKAVSI